MEHRRTALVTGASAGIGKAFVNLLAKQGYNLILVARRKDILEQIAREHRLRYNIRAEVIATDLGNIGAARDVAQRVEELGMAVDFLVNNAGFASHRTFCESSWNELHRELQVMVTAVTELCYRFAPDMASQGWGRIINLSSLAAFAPPTSSMLYTGIKSFVLNTSQALDMELKPRGVHVTALCPGFTQSEFHDVMGTREAMNRLPGFMWQDADTVAAAGFRAVMKGQPICTPGLFNKTVAGSSRMLPERVRYWLGKHAALFD